MANRRLKLAIEALSAAAALSTSAMREYSNAARVTDCDYGEGITQDGVSKAILRNRKNKNRGRKRG